MKSPTYLNALRAAEATGRLGSYSAAAEEIGVTPEAVGQLVRGLEGYVGVPLFRRDRRAGGLVATAAACAVLPALTRAMSTIACVLQRLREHSAEGILTVTAPPSFTAVWLVPRLDDFRRTLLGSICVST